MGLPGTNDAAWKPGQSGNPGGRPKGYIPFANFLRRELMKTDRRNKAHMEAIAEKVVALAMKGDMDAVRWIADRTDGKVSQQINVASEQTVHVVPWLPYVQSAAEAQEAQLEALGAGNGHAGADGVPRLEGASDASDASDRDSD
jgi:hypothetical protein